MKNCFSKEKEYSLTNNTFKYLFKCMVLICAFFFSLLMVNTTKVEGYEYSSSINMAYNSWGDVYYINSLNGNTDTSTLIIKHNFESSGTYKIGFGLLSAYTNTPWKVLEMDVSAGEQYICIQFSTSYYDVSISYDIDSYIYICIPYYYIPIAYFHDAPTSVHGSFQVYFYDAGGTEHEHYISFKRVSYLQQDMHVYLYVEEGDPILGPDGELYFSINDVVKFRGVITYDLSTSKFNDYYYENIVNQIENVLIPGISFSADYDIVNYTGYDWTIFYEFNFEIGYDYWANICPDDYDTTTCVGGLYIPKPHFEGGQGSSAYVSFTVVGDDRYEFWGTSSILALNFYSDNEAPTFKYTLSDGSGGNYVADNIDITLTGEDYMLPLYFLRSNHPSTSSNRVWVKIGSTTEVGMKSIVHTITYEGERTWYFKVCDWLYNCSVERAITTRIDKTAPEISSYTITPGNYTTGVDNGKYILNTDIVNVSLTYVEEHMIHNTIYLGSLDVSFFRNDVKVPHSTCGYSSSQLTNTTSSTANTLEFKCLFNSSVTADYENKISLRFVMKDSAGNVTNVSAMDEFYIIDTSRDPIINSDPVVKGYGAKEWGYIGSAETTKGKIKIGYYLENEEYVDPNKGYLLVGDYDQPAEILGSCAPLPDVYYDVINDCSSSGHESIEDWYEWMEYFWEDGLNGIYLGICNIYGRCAEYEEGSGMFYLDTEHPSVPTVTNSSNGQQVSTNVTITASGATDNYEVYEYQRSTDGTAWNNYWNEYNDFDGATHIFLATSPVNIPTLYVRVCDWAGNCTNATSTTSVKIVNENLAPQITIVDNIGYGSTGGILGTGQQTIYYNNSTVANKYSLKITTTSYTSIKIFIIAVNDYRTMMTNLHGCVDTNYYVTSSLEGSPYAYTLTSYSYSGGAFTFSDLSSKFLTRYNAYRGQQDDFYVIIPTIQFKNSSYDNIYVRNDTNVNGVTYNSSEPMVFRFKSYDASGVESEMSRPVVQLEPQNGGMMVATGVNATYYVKPGETIHATATVDALYRAGLSSPVYQYCIIDGYNYTAAQAATMGCSTLKSMQYISTAMSTKTIFHFGLTSTGVYWVLIPDGDASSSRGTAIAHNSVYPTGYNGYKVFKFIVDNVGPTLALTLDSGEPYTDADGEGNAFYSRPSTKVTLTYSGATGMYGLSYGDLRYQRASTSHFRYCWVSETVLEPDENYSCDEYMQPTYVSASAASQYQAYINAPSSVGTYYLVVEGNIKDYAGNYIKSWTSTTHVGGSANGKALIYKFIIYTSSPKIDLYTVGASEGLMAGKYTTQTSGTSVIATAYTQYPTSEADVGNRWITVMLSDTYGFSPNISINYWWSTSTARNDGISGTLTYRDITTNCLKVQGYVCYNVPVPVFDSDQIRYLTFYSYYSSGAKNLAGTYVGQNGSPTSTGTSGSIFVWFKVILDNSNPYGNAQSYFGNYVNGGGDVQIEFDDYNGTDGVSGFNVGTDIHYCWITQEEYDINLTYNCYNYENKNIYDMDFEITANTTNIFYDTIVDYEDETDIYLVVFFTDSSSGKLVQFSDKAGNTSDICSIEGCIFMLTIDNSSIDLMLWFEEEVILLNGIYYVKSSNEITFMFSDNEGFYDITPFCISETNSCDDAIRWIEYSELIYNGDSYADSDEGMFSFNFSDEVGYEGTIYIIFYYPVDITGNSGFRYLPDGYENGSNDNVIYTFVIDDTEPEFSGRELKSLNSLAQSGWTNTTALSLTESQLMDEVGLKSYNVYYKDVSIYSLSFVQSTIVSNTSTFTYRIDLSSSGINMSDGLQTITFEVCDLAGNCNETDESITLDRSAPEFAINGVGADDSGATIKINNGDELIISLLDKYVDSTDTINTYTLTPSKGIQYFVSKEKITDLDKYYSKTSHRFNYSTSEGEVLNYSTFYTDSIRIYSELTNYYLYVMAYYDNKDYAGNQLNTSESNKNLYLHEQYIIREFKVNNTQVDNSTCTTLECSSLMETVSIISGEDFSSSSVRYSNNIYQVSKDKSMFVVTLNNSSSLTINDIISNYNSYLKNYDTTNSMVSITSSDVAYSLSLTNELYRNNITIAFTHKDEDGNLLTKVQFITLVVVNNTPLLEKEVEGGNSGASVEVDHGSELGNIGMAFVGEKEGRISVDTLITLNGVRVKEIDTSVSGVYSVTRVAKDKLGRSTKVTREIVVKDEVVVSDEVVNEEVLEEKELLEVPVKVNVSNEVVNEQVNNTRRVEVNSVEMRVEEKVKFKGYSKKKQVRKNKKEKFSFKLFSKWFFKIYDG